MQSPQKKRYIIYKMCVRARARERKNGALNGNRRKFCNFPYISCSVFPSRNTSRQNNLFPFHRRNRDKVLYPYILSPILQNVCRISGIYIAKKAYFFLLSSNSTRLLYANTPLLASVFYTIFLYKIAFPSMKLSKKPLTSNPVFSKQPIRCSGVATPYLFCA